MDFDTDAVVVGGGFSGILAVHHLRKRGFRVKGIEKSQGLGGVWRTSLYPGARPDSPQPYYQFFDEELSRGWTWSEPFPAQPELSSYFDYVDKTWSISKDYVFSVSVTSAIFNAKRCGWTVLLSDGSQITAQWLIPAVGHASQPNSPEVAGFERFQGQTFHTANWPAHPITWADNRVSIIGTGASAVQIIQELAPQVQHLTVFQRSPMVGFSKTRYDSTTGDEAGVTEYTNTNLARRIFATSTTYHSGFPYEFRKDKMSSLSDEDIEKHFAKTLSQGNWCYLLSSFEESVYNPESNAKMYTFWATQTRRRILNERLRDLLVPLSPKAPIGMKRPCLEANYYETFDRGNVELVVIKAEDQMELTETGILYGNTHYDSDYIIWATGFESRAVNLTNMDIQGNRGISLKETWLNKVSTNLGMTVAGFPNMFMVYGPQSATVRVNGPSVIDAQIAWMCSTLEQLRSAGVIWFEPTKASERAWLYKMEVPWNSSLYSQTETWETRGMSGNTTEPAWILGLPAYIEELQKCSENGYQGFIMKSRKE